MKKLIPALCMLLIAAAMLGTSTYAWFSMNTTVTATGMQVKAKSDSKFLQIKTTGDWNDTDPFTTANLSMAESKAIYPTHPFKSIAGDKKSAEAFDGTSVVWASTYSTSATAAKEGVGDSNLYETVANPSENHALVQEFKLRLKPGVGATTSGALTVSSVTFTAKATEPDVTDSLADALRVLVVCGENKVIYKNGTVKEAGAATLATSVAQATDTTVTVYVYFDGEDSACTTNNALTPDDYQFEISFQIA
jgi:hypothetical protein